MKLVTEKTSLVMIHAQNASGILVILSFKVELNYLCSKVTVRIGDIELCHS